MKGYRKILIAFNNSVNVLKKGLTLAGDEGCWVTVLKVMPSYEGDLSLTGVTNIDELMGFDVSQAAMEIKNVVQEERKMAKVRIEEGDIPQTISKVAEEERCDLVVLGKKKKQGFFERMMFKRFLNKMIDSVPCPVFIVEA